MVGWHRVSGAAGDVGDYTMYPEGYPDFPMPQTLTTSRENGAVKISCLVSDLCFDWRLRPSGSGTEITVHVEIPDHEAHRLVPSVRSSAGRSGGWPNSPPPAPRAAPVTS